MERAARRWHRQQSEVRTYVYQAWMDALLCNVLARMVGRQGPEGLKNHGKAAPAALRTLKNDGMVPISCFFNAQP